MPPSPHPTHIRLVSHQASLCLVVACALYHVPTASSATPSSYIPASFSAFACTLKREFCNVGPDVEEDAIGDHATASTATPTPPPNVPPAPAEDVQCCVSTVPVRDPSLDTCGGTRPTGLPFAGRSPVFAQNGMAATSQPLSTQAALDILKLGGSAVDAAIAANAMEGVVEPMMNGVGGDLMAMVWDNKAGKLTGYNGAGRAAADTTLDDMRNLVKSAGGTGEYMTANGPLPVTVPGAARGWCDLHARFGKLPLSTVLAPAIKYATDGFPVSPVIASDWYIPQNDSEMTSGGKYPHALDGFMQTFTINGKIPQAGQLFHNPDLANTLTKIGMTNCTAFYEGEVAQALVAFSKVSGLRLTADDLANHHGVFVDPVNTTYRDRYRLFELPPNPQGIAAIQQLNILEGFNLTNMGHNTADYLHVHIEAKKLAFADRARYYADPDFVHVPVQGLISKEYAAARRTLINMSQAAQVVDAGTPAEQDKPYTGDTIYVTTADGEGNMVSLIQSNYMGFGSGLVVPGLGFALQNRGNLFNILNDSAADVYAPGKRPFHTIIPGFVTKDEKPWLSFGVMGGNMQPQGHAQILSNIIDFGMNVQEAGDAARYYHTGSSQPTGEVMTDGGVVILEAGVCPAARAELTRRGHVLKKGPNGGGYQAIMRDPTFTDGTIVYHGASEMRKDGQAAGY
eukprot:m.22751 g.22751  ORF g.22751 m.22751 type:complete len:682 (+) comp4022_c0_seq1:119-2164(+)